MNSRKLNTCEVAEEMDGKTNKQNLEKNLDMGENQWDTTNDDLTWRTHRRDNGRVTHKLRPCKTSVQPHKWFGTRADGISPFSTRSVDENQENDLVYTHGE